MGYFSFWGGELSL